MPMEKNSDAGRFEQEAQKAYARFAPLAGAMRAAKSEITVLDEKAIAADPIRIGLKGSPTKVVTIFPPPVKGGGEKVDARGDAAAGAKAIARFLAEKGLVK